MTKTKSLNEIREIIENRGYKFLEMVRDKNSHVRVIIEDSNGYKYDTRIGHIISNHIPQFVGKNNRFSIFNIRLWIEKNRKPFELLKNNTYNGNKRKLVFQCLNFNCKEIFEYSWNNIYSQDYCCPFCSGRKVGKYNNLEYLRHDLVKDWDYDKNKNLPSCYTEFSHENVYWKCSICGGKWETTIISRSNGNGCPFCSGRNASESNNLEFLRPDIVLEWDYNKNDISPSKYTEKSGKMVWWICSRCNHNWKAKIYSRSNGSGCPRCSSSKGEKRIHNFLSSTKINFYIEFPLEGCKYKKQLWLDFYIQDLNIGIEYHGGQHYYPVEFFGGEKAFKEQKKRDKIKEKYCKDNNIKLIIISYWEIDNIEKILEENLLNT